MTRALSYPAPCLLAVRSKTPERREDLQRGTLWTDAEVTWLLRNYSQYTARYCAHHLRRSESAVTAKASGMGLRAKSYVTSLTMKDIVARFCASNSGAQPA